MAARCRTARLARREPSAELTFNCRNGGRPHQAARPLVSLENLSAKEAFMFLIRPLIASVALAVLFLTGSANAKTPDNVATAQRAEMAAPMSKAALEKLYAGRTWQWGSEGAGFFSAQKNARGWFSVGRKRFVAWTRNGRTSGYGEGDWYATRGGKLCIRALWTARGDSNGAITCFLHRERNGVIYQKRSFGGEWYVFRANPVQRSDEVRKLVKGDRASKEASRLKAIGR